jgi:hypothetical protein
MRFETAHGTEILKELRLPWNTPLTDWSEEESAALGPDERMVHAKGCRYILKAFPEPRAREAFSRLETLHAFGQPVVRPVGLVTERAGLPALLVTSWPREAIPLEDALGAARDPEPLAEALAFHLAHLHLAGYHGGASTLASPLIRRGDDRFAAILADLSAGELVNALSSDQRQADLHAAKVNLARAVRGANHRRRERLEPESFATSVVDTYTRFWSRFEQTHLFAQPGEVAVRTRIFSVGSVPGMTREQLRTESENPFTMTIWSQSSKGSDHRLMVHLLTGLEVGDDRSRDLLRDLNRHRSWLEMSTGRPWPRALAANRWLRDVYRPAMKSLAGLKTGEACH